MNPTYPMVGVLATLRKFSGCNEDYRARDYLGSISKEDGAY